MLRVVPVDLPVGRLVDITPAHGSLGVVGALRPPGTPLGCELELRTLGRHSGVNDAEVHASAEICYCLYDGKEVVYFEGRTDGEIALTPKGNQGFGWDAIFIPNGHEKTWGEMNADEKDATSMRSGAIKKLREYLQDK